MILQEVGSRGVISKRLNESLEYVIIINCAAMRAELINKEKD